jgi:hypothetical protein
VGRGGKVGLREIARHLRGKGKNHRAEERKTQRLQALVRG